MRGLVLCVSLVLAAAWSACSSEAPRGEGRGLLVIAIDGLRADHVSCYGYDRQTTPELDELAREGVRFTNAFSTSPQSFQACASLLTGCDPLVSKRILPPELPPMMLTHWNIPERAPHVAQELLRRGWSTLAVLDDPLLTRPFGVARGFRDFQGYDREKPPSSAQASAAGAFERLARWLAEREAEQNWFAFVHLNALQHVWSETDPVWDAHFSPRPELALVPPTGEARRLFFAIPRPHWSGGMRTLGEYEAEYDGAIARLDQTIGRALDGLRASGRLDTTTILVVGTRGVGFGEAGLYLDAGTLADVDLHVPLIVRPARALDAERGGTSGSLVSLVDVAPTVLEFASAPSPAEMQGVSFARALRELDVEVRPFAFARGAYQDGSSVIGARYCLDETRPWLVDENALSTSWYGGVFPRPLEPRVVLHDRSADTSVGHRTSAPLDPALVANMREAAQRWNTEVELLRRAFQSNFGLPFGAGLAVER